MRGSTVRRIIALIIVLSVLRILWMWIVEDPDAASSFVLQEKGGGGGGGGGGAGGGEVPFPGRSCVLQGDGDRCVPLHESKLHHPRKGLHAFNRSFYLDGAPFRIVGGSFHYFRTQPAHWGDRLLKMKAAGLNVVTTYVPWNLHERMRGRYEFAGHWDLPSFIRHVDNVGLKLVVRPGPYICSEWEWGGLPAWLMHDPKMRVRTSKYKPFLDAVAAYFSKLLPLLAGYQYSKGAGPIIAFQVENEFGSFGNDPPYMQFVKEQFDRHGLTELLITSDGGRMLGAGQASGALSTVNFQHDPHKNLQLLRLHQPDQPLMVTEYWTGWFDHWGERHHTQNITELRHKLTVILDDYAASINFYMFVGGTNFEFWNGANHGGSYQPTITSYDYDAPVSECGDTTPKYFMIRELVASLGLAPRDVPEVPANTAKKAYGRLTLSEVMTFADLVDLVPATKVTVERRPLPMEQLHINNESGQSVGFLVYQKRVKGASTSALRVSGRWNDRLLVLVDGVRVATFESMADRRPVPIPPSGKRAAAAATTEHLVELVVENLGRVNFKLLSQQWKGFKGELLDDRGDPLPGRWRHVPLEFDEQLRQAIRRSGRWRPYERQQAQPALYRAELVLDDDPPADTFLDMGAPWRKGVVLVNGFTLGRYWELGPQQTLYVPAPLLLQGRNEIIVFETEKLTKDPVLVFRDEPILQCASCTKRTLKATTRKNRKKSMPLHTKQKVL